MKNIFISCKLSDSQSGEVYSVEKNWYDFFENMNINLIPININNFSKKMVINSKPKGIIIPGGNDLYKIKKKKINLIRDKFEYKLINYSIEKKIPLVAVCKGFQVIADYYNGKIKKCKNHVGTTHNLKIDDKSRFVHYKQLTVNSFHNYGILRLPNQFNIISKTNDKFIEIAEHKEKKILCFMFHPERICKSKSNLKSIIKNFFKIQ